jgi:DMSO reductase anchor subunit
MLRSIFMGIRSCFKKTAIAFVMTAAAVVKRLRTVVTNMFSAVKDGATWVKEQAKTPAKECVKAMSFAAFKQFLVFVCGFACTLLFTEAAGDLTWFSRMLTSVEDSFRLTLRRAWRHLNTERFQT